ncbi:MAG: protein-disulfide reductase DsbD domain-containing protein, partial [Methylocella sp.]
GEVWQAGVVVDLDAGWKTYWRMPGEAGIPPQFDWKKSKGIAGVEVLYPLPERLQDASGETIGYAGRVIFPVLAKLAADATDASLHLDLFLAVCKDICIPAKAQAAVPVGRTNAQDLGLLEAWAKRVPVPGTAVQSVHAAMDAGIVVLVAKLARSVDDIFVESATSAYFKKPAFSGDGLEASLIVGNVKDAAEIQGLDLKLTVAVDGTGIEQVVTVA